MHRKGLVIVSDMFDKVGRILTGLRHFRHRRNDIIVFHILDWEELEFPIQRLTQFEGLEEIDIKLLADPRALRSAYLEEINSYLKTLKSGCLANKIDYVLLSTAHPLDVALSAYLAARASKIRK